MNVSWQGAASLAARLMIAGIFVMSAVGNKIPNFSGVAEVMAGEGVPAPKVALAGAIAFLVVGGLSLAAGYRARIGAGLLLVFLALATYYFHDFWNFDGPEKQGEMIQFLKNVSLMGGLLFIVANGAGGMSLDARSAAVDTDG
ncbi:MAG: DoxX family protein [Planctomycetota bacterium]